MRFRNITLLLICLFILMSILLFVSNRMTQKQLTSLTNIPTPTPLALPNETYQKAQDRFVPTIYPQLQRDSLINKLRYALPYQGTYFSLSYDIDTNLFTLKLNEANIAVANKEYEAFLKTNRIDSPTWITNISTVYK